MSCSVVRAMGALWRPARAAGVLLVVGGVLSAFAADAPMLTGPIQEVFVNGGPDTVNGGQSCFSMPNLPAACRGVIAIPNRNKDLLAAAVQQKPSTREWFADARNYALYSNDGGQYDDLAKYLKLR